MAKRRPPDDELTAALRRAIRDSGESIKGLAKAAGIARMSLARFANGERSLRLDKAGKLAAYFGLHLAKKG
jgi:plasmid maintenance system antidote protein VapI